MSKHSRRKNSSPTSTSEPASTKTPSNTAPQQVPAGSATTAPAPVAEAASNEAPESSGFGCLARMYWMMWGNFAVIVCALVVSRQGNHLGMADVVYWLFVASLPGVRYLDMKGSAGSNTEPNTGMKGWRRYTVLIVGLGLLVWLGAHWAGKMLAK